MRSVIFALAVLGLLAGCVPSSLTLAVRGAVQGSSETFYGSATGYAGGSGHLEVFTSMGARCHGSFVYVTHRRGEGVFQCSDGRSGPFSFVSTGYNGVGQGSLGYEIFTFSFG